MISACAPACLHGQALGGVARRRHGDRRAGGHVELEGLRIALQRGQDLLAGGDLGAVHRAERVLARRLHRVRLHLQRGEDRGARREERRVGEPHRGVGLAADHGHVLLLYVGGPAALGAPASGLTTASTWSTWTSWRMSAWDLVASPWSSSTISLIWRPLMPPLALTESTQACRPARCSGSADGPEKLPMVPMTRSDPDAATAEPELAALVLVLVLLPLLLLLQAVARAATATPSTDARSRAVLFAFFITGSNPQESGRGRSGDWSARRRAPGALTWPESPRR